MPYHQRSGRESSRREFFIEMARRAGLLDMRAAVLRSVCIGLATIGAFFLAAASASAGGCLNGGECYTKVWQPSVFATITQPVVVQPASRHVVHEPALIGARDARVAVQPGRWHAEHSPAVYATVAKPVLVAPAQVSYSHVPARYRRVHETVVVQPAAVAWHRSRDWHGRETLCKVHPPAVTRTVERAVMIAPAGKIAHHTPAVYREETRHVLVRSASTNHVYQPAVHEWVSEPYMARPARSVTVYRPAVVAFEQRRVPARQGGYAWQRTGYGW